MMYSELCEAWSADKSRKERTGVGALLRLAEDVVVVCKEIIGERW